MSQIINLRQRFAVNVIYKIAAIAAQLATCSLLHALLQLPAV